MEDGWRQRRSCELLVRSWNLAGLGVLSTAGLQIEASQTGLECLEVAGISLVIARHSWPGKRSPWEWRAWDVSKSDFFLHPLSLDLTRESHAEQPVQ